MWCAMCGFIHLSISIDFLANVIWMNEQRKLPLSYYDRLFIFSWSRLHVLSVLAFYFSIITISVSNNNTSSIVLFINILN